MNNRGMSLLEMMFALGIFTIVMGVILAFSMSVGETASVENGKTSANDQARQGLQVVVRELRGAALSTLSSLPSGQMTYRVATDIDGNGSAVDIGGNLELSAPRTIGRDIEDVNGDGITGKQLVLINGGIVRVLATGLLPDEDTNSNRVLDADEDINGNGRLDHGVWFEPWGNGLRVTIQTLETSQKGAPLPGEFQEVVFPRN